MDAVRVTSAYYAARAPEYDASAGYLDPKVETLRIPIKARYQAVFRGRNVLEIACGTGYWTAAIAAEAASVFAIDRDPRMLALARRRLAQAPHVRIELADAYALISVPEDFNAAFAIHWWSHMPRRRIPAFLDVLCAHLCPGARVMFVDELPYDRGRRRRIDEEGNLLEERTLFDGRRFEIVKNFPTREELFAAVRMHAVDFTYREPPGEGRWEISFRSR